MTASHSELLQAVEAMVASIRSLDASAEGRFLDDVACVMRGLASSPLWADASWREAAPGEECLHELAVASGAASLYLVSDGVGVSSPPHRHGTWAVIAGIRGNELNVLHRDASGGTVVPMERVEVGAGESLILAASAIHSTEVVGLASTFHLHLYGKPLSELGSFASRRLAAASGVPAGT